MAYAIDSLEAFEAIHYDLDSLCNIDRLAKELEAHVESFRKLLDHDRRNLESRQHLQAAQKLTIRDTIYQINDDFRNSIFQLADELDIDELQCAELLLDAQVDSNELDRSPIVSAVMRYHRRRQYLLECLRLAFHTSIEGGDFDDQTVAESDALQDVITFRYRTQRMLGTFVSRILDNPSPSLDNASNFWNKCLSSLHTLEDNLVKVQDRMQRATLLGQALSVDEGQILEFEKETLNIQHESLSSVMAFLLSQGRVSRPDHFHSILTRLRKLDKHDLIMLHYLPIAMTCAVQFGSSSATYSEAEVKSLHAIITGQSELETWASRPLCRAFRAWWLAEYRGRFADDLDAQRPSVAAENRLMLDSLRDGGLQFMLSIAQDVRRNDWHDPAKLHLTTFFLKGFPVLPPDAPRVAPHFETLLMDHFQSFIDAFISNMPDTIRQLRLDEDDQRKLLRSRFQSTTSEYAYDLDRFLTIIAYAYQDSPESAKSFWADNDSNLYGFLQWAAKRQTTPRAAAFCEMLRSLSEGEQCADSAHQFLLEEGPPVASKLRRGVSLSWSQIFTEFEHYAVQSRDRPSLALAQTEAQLDQTQSLEPESGIMLECYLRLLSHICTASSQARNWLVANEHIALPQLIFQLMGSSNDGRVRAWCFTVLASLLKFKSTTSNSAMWERLEQWITGTSPGTFPTNRTQLATLNPRSDKAFLELSSTDFEETNGFLHLLNSLISPTFDEYGLANRLPFPESLGAPHRLPGIGLYVDFVLGNAFAEKTQKMSNLHDLHLVRLSCLDFIYATLNGFNDDLVILKNIAGKSSDASAQSPSLESYVTLHPFARVMAWLFEDRCLSALFATVKQDVHVVNQALSDSPMVLSLVRAIEVMNMILQLQPIYLDVVRPFQQKKELSEKSVTRSPVASFENAVLNHLDIIVNLGLYCGLGHAELTITSLALLEKLSCSPRLAKCSGQAGNYSDGRSRLVAALQKEGEVLRISHALGSALAIDDRELEAGPAASGYSIKSGVLSFLRNTLKAAPGKHNIALLMLGLSLRGGELVVEDKLGYPIESCLLVNVCRLSINFPDSDGSSILTWATNIKEACMDVLRTMWQMPISSTAVMTLLKEADYAFLLALNQHVIGPRTLWNGRMLDDANFMASESALALRNFLRQRSAYLDYMIRELRNAKGTSASSHLRRLQLSLLGSTSLPGQSSVATPNIFELFDFAELNVDGSCPQFQGSEHFTESQFEACTKYVSLFGPVYDISRVKEVIAVEKQAFMADRGRAGPSRGLNRAEEHEMSLFDHAATEAVQSISAINQWREVSVAHAETLELWTRLITVLVQICEFDTLTRLALWQQAYQLLVPKFEKLAITRSHAATELACLFVVLLTDDKSAEPSVTAGENGTTKHRNGMPSHAAVKREGANSVKSMEFSVFRAALNVTVSPSTTLALREVCYRICYLYLRKVIAAPIAAAGARRNVLRNVKSICDSLVEHLCDDAQSSQNCSSISALLFLEALAAIMAVDAPKLLLNSLHRINFVPILVDSIRQIPRSLQDVDRQETRIVVDYHRTCMALLLRLAQTRAGALAIYNAGLLAAVRDSELFSIDPDVGLDNNGSEGISDFFRLMLAALRIINTLVIWHQSEPVMTALRAFIMINRVSIIGILKRFAAVGKLQAMHALDLTDLVDNLTVLISATLYLEHEDSSVNLEQHRRESIFS